MLVAGVETLAFDGVVVGLILPSCRFLLQRTMGRLGRGSLRCLSESVKAFHLLGCLVLLNIPQDILDRLLPLCVLVLVDGFLLCKTVSKQRPIQ